MKNSGDLKLADEDPMISALPDEILCHILSFLIPLYAVQTTVLSKRWNNLWTSCITNLDFDMYNFPSSWSNYHIFVRFVDQVLALRDSSKDITRFRVAWAFCEDFSIIARWIQVAVNANVVELDIEFSVECCDGPIYVRPFEMPSCVYTCKTLVSLKVKSDYLTYYSLPKTGCCFPNLKSLHYICDYDPDRASGDNLFRSCPALEELTIEAHHRKRVLNFDISSPELRTLTTIITQKEYDEDECDEDSDEESAVEDSRIEPCNFFIDATKLENLCVKGEVMSKYIWKSTSSLVQARVQLQEFNEASPDLVAELFDIVSSVRYMTISALEFEPRLLQAFRNLIKLELVFYKQSCWKWLAEVLNKSPNLESLVLNFAKIGGDSFQPPDFVPTCLSSQLKTISMKGFKGTPNEIDMAKYLLSYGEVLHKVIVSSPRCCCIGDAEEKILSFEKGSNTRQVEFIKDVNSELSSEKGSETSRVKFFEDSDSQSD